MGSLYVRSIPQVEPARLALGQQAFSGFPAMLAVLLVSGPGALTAVPDHLVALLALGIRWQLAWPWKEMPVIGQLLFSGEGGQFALDDIQRLFAFPGGACHGITFPKILVV